MGESPVVQLVCNEISSSLRHIHICENLLKVPGQKQSGIGRARWRAGGKRGQQGSPDSGMPETGPPGLRADGTGGPVG